MTQEEKTPPVEKTCETFLYFFAATISQKTEEKRLFGGMKLSNTFWRIKTNNLVLTLTNSRSRLGNILVDDILL